jgi:ribonuclease I
MLVTSVIPYYAYFLALQKCHSTSNYTIHGLWIDYKKGGYPEFCNRTTFNVTELHDIRRELDIHWPSCQGANQGLWEHEWKKHGTCFKSMSLHSYFKTTVDIYKKKNVNTICNKHDCLIPVEHVEIY